jgi:hypothetical protein
MHQNSPPLLTSSFLAGTAAVVFLSAVLFFLRFLSNISFTEPLHLITSGSEEQSFLSLWKFINDQPVYTDPHKIPFTSSYVNWLFYGFYGMAIKGLLLWRGISDDWIPTLGRLISFLFSVAGFFIARLTLIELFPKLSGKEKFLFLLIPFYLFLGPLAAFWPMTVRPDMAAVIFELLAFYFFVKEFQNHLPRAAFLATLLSFTAWSFKQTNISVFLSLLIFCFIHDCRAAWLMGLLMGALCASVAWFGGPAYRESTLFSLPIPGFSLRLGLVNFLYYLAEFAFALPGYIALGAALFSRTLKEKIQRDKVFQLCFITAVVSSLYGGITSLKIGASENYFIPASFFVTFFFLSCFFDLRQRPLPGIFNLSLYFSFVINGLLILAILFGIKGKVSKRYEHRETLELLKSAQSLPRPVFSQTMYLNLPWMLGDESFIPGYTYWVEKERGKKYERGGIEGLIREGYFGSLIFEKAKMHEILGEVGADTLLQHYTEQNLRECPPTHAIFVKRGLFVKG